MSVFTFDGAAMRAITSFVEPEVFPRFALPPELERGRYVPSGFS